jgi:hypothetical protein
MGLPTRTGESTPFCAQPRREIQCRLTPLAPSGHCGHWAPRAAAVEQASSHSAVGGTHRNMQASHFPCVPSDLRGASPGTGTWKIRDGGLSSAPASLRWTPAEGGARARVCETLSVSRVATGTGAIGNWQNRQGLHSLTRYFTARSLRSTHLPLDAIPHCLFWPPSVRLPCLDSAHGTCVHLSCYQVQLAPGGQMPPGTGVRFIQTSSRLPELCEHLTTTTTHSTGPDRLARPRSSAAATASWAIGPRQGRTEHCIQILRYRSRLTSHDRFGRSSVTKRGCQW